MSDKNGHVRWPAFASIIIVIFCFIVGTSSYIVATTVSSREFLQFEKRIDDKMVSILDEIKGLKE